MSNPFLPLFHRNFREEGPLNICFFGDSITQGCFEKDTCDQISVYHHVLGEMLAKAFPAMPLNIINAGRGGDTTTDALHRIDRDVLCHRPHITVVYFGTNDVWDDDLSTFAKNLAEIVRLLKQSGSLVLLMTGTHMNKKVRVGLSPDHAEIAEKMAVRQHSGKVANVFAITRDYALQNNIPLLDLYTHYSELEAKGVDTDTLLANGINHPTREAHAMFAQKLFTIFTQN